jgi:putative heme iron utilization protein
MMEANDTNNQMEKKYEKPRMEIIVFLPENICLSGGFDEFGMFGSTYP